MPVQVYETLFILDSTKHATDVEASKTALHATIERYGGTIDVSRPWDDRKLTYPIKKHKKGSYHIVYYRIESTKQAEMERDYRLNETILRHMTSAIDPKWVDAVMDVAKNDHAPAFAIRGLQDESAPMDISPNLGEGLPEGEAVTAATGGRRPPRREMAEKPE